MKPTNTISSSCRTTSTTEILISATPRAVQTLRFASLPAEVFYGSWRSAKRKLNNNYLYGTFSFALSTFGGPGTRCGDASMMHLCGHIYKYNDSLNCLEVERSRGLGVERLGG